MDRAHKIKTSIPIFISVLTTVIVSFFVFFSGGPVDERTVSAQNLIPTDICPEGECPVASPGLSDDLESESRDILTRQEDSSFLVISIFRFILFIIIAISVIATPVLFITGVIAIILKNTKTGIGIILVGPVIILICVLHFTLISIIQTLI